jgi:hypothetical protein
MPDAILASPASLLLFSHFLSSPKDAGCHTLPDCIRISGAEYVLTDAEAVKKGRLHTCGIFFATNGEICGRALCSTLK